MSRKNRTQSVLCSLTAEHVEQELESTEWKNQRFAEIADQYRTRMLMRARRITDCREEAEDIVQEAYLKALRGLPNFRGDSKMESWLYSIMKNATLEHLRNRKRHGFRQQASDRSDDNQEIMLEIPDTRADPEEACARREIEQILLSEVDKLDSRCRRTVQTCFLNETPHRIAAESMGVGVSTIKSRVFRGKRLLKKALSPCIRGLIHQNLLTDRSENL